MFDRPLDWSLALEFLQPFLESDRFDVLTMDEGHWDVLAEVLGTLTHPAGNLFFDVRTAALMLGHGIRRIYTTDTDFLQFGGIEAINPLELLDRLQSALAEAHFAPTHRGAARVTGSQASAKTFEVWGKAREALAQGVRGLGQRAPGLG